MPGAWLKEAERRACLGSAPPLLPWGRAEARRGEFSPLPLPNYSIFRPNTVQSICSEYLFRVSGRVSRSNRAFKENREDRENRENRALRETRETEQTEHSEKTDLETPVTALSLSMHKRSDMCAWSVGMCQNVPELLNVRPLKWQLLQFQCLSLALS